MPEPKPSAGSRAARFFFMHLGTLVSVIVYFQVCGASGYSADGVRSALFTALIVAISLGVGGALLAEAGLSFLGLGVQPPNASRVRANERLRIGRKESIVR